MYKIEIQVIVKCYGIKSSLGCIKKLVLDIEKY